MKFSKKKTISVQENIPPLTPIVPQALTDTVYQAKLLEQMHGMMQLVTRRRGRPAKTPGKHVVKVSVSLPAEIAQKLKDASTAQAKGTSSLVSEALQRYLQE